MSYPLRLADFPGGLEGGTAPSAPLGGAGAASTTWAIRGGGIGARGDGGGGVGGRRTGGGKGDNTAACAAARLSAATLTEVSAAAALLAAPAATLAANAAVCRSVNDNGCEVPVAGILTGADGKAARGLIALARSCSSLADSSAILSRSF